MKALYYIGLVIFSIGIILFFGREIKPSYFESIDDIYIDIMWPIGLMMYGIGLAGKEKKHKEKSEEHSK